jgi:hypothetical protein
MVRQPAFSSMTMMTGSGREPPVRRRSQFDPEQPLDLSRADSQNIWFRRI